MVQKEIDTKKCVHCNKDIRLTSKFCSFCGGKNVSEEVSLRNDIDRSDHREEKFESIRNDIDGAGYREEKFETFFSAMGDAFNIDIPDDIDYDEEYEEELFDEEDFEELSDPVF